MYAHIYDGFSRARFKNKDHECPPSPLYNLKMHVWRLGTTRVQFQSLTLNKCVFVLHA